MDYEEIIILIRSTGIRRLRVQKVQTALSVSKRITRYYLYTNNYHLVPRKCIQLQTCRTFSRTRCFPDLLSDFARVTAVLHGGQLHVDVLRGTALAHGPGGGVCQRRVCDALVLRHRLGSASRSDSLLRLVEELQPRHRTVSCTALRWCSLCGPPTV